MLSAASNFPKEIAIAYAIIILRIKAAFGAEREILKAIMFCSRHDENNAVASLCVTCYVTK